MNSEEFARLEQVFAAAAALPAAEQLAFVDASEVSAEIKAEARRLLLADRQAGGFLERSVELEAARLADERSRGEQSWQGRMIGPYRVVSELGSGGMSSVMLAVRADDEFEQQVAIKVLRWGSATTEILERFRTERRILASLDHPQIAKLYDGGTTEDGLPYFVMEVITGEPIDQYCRVEHLDLPARLRLFRQVAAAVEYAHRSLVVHRDIKPSNVLVTPDGSPKLLDFGIAKMIDPSLDRGGRETALGWRWLTPRYASPEQIRAEPVTTASDVYSLGVVLYELLTGEAPHGEFSSQAELERAVLHDDPVPPSLSVGRRSEQAMRRLGLSTSATEWAANLKGDLDNILSKALARSPAERYGSVEQFSTDLYLYLQGHPITARPATIGYRTAKFLRRHRLAAGLAAAAVCSLLAFAVIVTTLLARTREERDRSLQITSLLEDTFEIADPNEIEGSSITARELLDRSADRVRTELAGQPETQARLFHALGMLYLRLALHERAYSVFAEEKVALQEASEQVSEEMGECLNQLGRSSVMLGHYREAESHFREALSVRRQVFGDNHPRVADSLNNVALILHDQGRYDEAEPYYRQSVDIDKRLGEDARAISYSWLNLGLLRQDQGIYDEAVQLIMVALEQRRLLVGEEHTRFADACVYLAQAERSRGRLDEGERWARQALRIFALRKAPDLLEVARAQTALGGILVDAGRLDEAGPPLEAALAERRKLLKDSQDEVAETWTELGRLKAARGELGAAEELYRKAAQSYLLGHGGPHPLRGRPLAALGHLLAEQGRCGDAEAVIEEALRLSPEPTLAARAARSAAELCGLHPAGSTR